MKTDIKKSVFKGLLMASFPLLLSSCFSFSNFQTGRSLGKGNSEFGASISYLGTGGDAEFVGLPMIELGGKYGISENFDMGMRIGNFGNILLESKYQFTGDKTSSFAAATGLSVGGSFVGFNLGEGSGVTFFQYEIPLHLSAHPSENFAVYFTPRYMGIGGSADGDGGLSHLLLFSPGIEIGQKFKFGVNLNVIAPLSDFFDANFLYQFGVGMKYQFSN
jgi:hypothetical protein